jgi:hypothetical protein
MIVLIVPATQWKDAFRFLPDHTHPARGATLAVFEKLDQWSSVLSSSQQKWLNGITDHNSSLCRYILRGKMRSGREATCCILTSSHTFDELASFIGCELIPSGIGSYGKRGLDRNRKLHSEFGWWSTEARENPNCIWIGYRILYFVVVQSQPYVQNQSRKIATWLILPVAYACLKD